MKKIYAYLGIALAATLSLSNCTKQIEAPVTPEQDGTPFEVSALLTKTTNDGYETKWAATDGINIFHAENGATSYTSDNEFTLYDAATGTFKGTLTGTLDGSKTYDWYAFYPYSSYNKTPAGVDNATFGYTTVGGTTQTQTGNNSTAHLCGKACPLYGVTTGVAANDVPAFTMKNLTSVICVEVTNGGTEALTVSSIAFTSTEDIVGTYYINFTGATPVYKATSASYVSSTAKLTVSGGAAIAAGGSAKFYIAIKPHTVASGSTLKLSVNGYEKGTTVSKDTNFEAGKIKTVKFKYDKPDYAVTIPWTEDFSGGIDKYTVTGSSTSIKNENYAGGTAPELMVGKSGESFSATVKADATEKSYTLYFKTNDKYDKLSVTSETSGVTIKKEMGDGVYSIAVTDAVDKFKLTFTTTTSDNVRLDDILLVGKRDALSAPTNVKASLNTDDTAVTNSIDVTWDAVTNAGSYVVTATPSTGTVVKKEVTVTNYTFTDLAYETEYTITVSAKPSDVTKYTDSAAATADKTVTTGTNTSGKTVYTYTMTTSAFTATGYGKPINDITATSSDGKTLTVGHKSSNAGLQSSKIQFKKSAGVIYNTTDLGTVKSVVLGTPSHTNYTIYTGTSENPTTSGTGGYFAIKETSGTLLTCISITVTFEK